MKIVFMGTPEGAALLLEKLAGPHSISAVITRPDKPKGRGLKVYMSPVAERAERLGIQALKPSNINDPQIIANIKEIAPDIIIVAAYGRILSKELLNMPKYGCVNVHLSLLPKYRGASPVQSALLNGDTETGITVMLMNERLDEGDILLSETVRIKENETAGELTERLFIIGGDLLLRTLPGIESGSLKPVPQDNSRATYCKPIKKTDGLIDINTDSNDLLNKIRAFSPWPGAYWMFRGKRIKILSAKPHADTFGPAEPGTAVGHIKNEGLAVRAKNGVILIKEVQPENSKKMSAEEFMNGYRIKIGEKIF